MVNQPKISQTVSSPLKISGKAKGSWFFEGSFPVILTDWDGKIIAETQAKTDKDWTTEELIPFQATLEFTLPDNLACHLHGLFLTRKWEDQ